MGLASSEHRVIAVAAEPERARARLGELAREGRVRVTNGEALDGACVWIDGSFEGAIAIAARARGEIPIVVSELAPDRWSALAELEAQRRAPVIVSGPGIGTLTLARMLGRIRSEQPGALERLVVRAPGGRRVAPAASRRTAFGADGRVRWELDASERARLANLIAPFVRVAELLVPGSADRLAISELIRGDAPRVVMHAIIEGVSVAVNVDREMRGDEDWEVEALCARGTLLARFRGPREVLFARAPLRKEEVESSERPADELLVRHALKNERSRFGSAGEAARVHARCERILGEAASRRDARTLRVVLVHVPRFKNRFDELRLPSLAIARLSAYLRGHGFEVRVVDLEATHGERELAHFADDARVDAWLAGGCDAALDEALEPLFAAIDDAIEAPSLVGFSVVDYFGHFQMNLASALARLVKERKGQPTVLGGERDQVDTERAFGPHMRFDYVVDGDGEAALYELACLESEHDRDARSIAAVASRRPDGSLVRNPIVRSHLNAMPRPDFDGMPLDRYRRGPSAALLAALARDGVAIPDARPFGYLPYGFVKGCTADCTFCSAKEHLDVQAPEKTVDELLALADRYAIRDFVFLDNLVNLGARWLTRFCRLLVDARADLQWTDSCRPTDIDDELAALMREAGCLLLNFGAESGSDAVLARMQKGLTRADILKTLRATHRAGIVNRVNLIAGYFHETPADVDLTISLVEELASEIDVIGCFQGFYLFAGMGVDPAREGIVLRERMDRLKTGQLTLAYDEIGGLPWEAKRDAIDASRNRILGRIEELAIRTVDKIDEHDLFWLSRAFRDKAMTRRYVLAEPPASHARPALPPGGQRGRVDAS